MRLKILGKMILKERWKNRVRLINKVNKYRILVLKLFF